MRGEVVRGGVIKPWDGSQQNCNYKLYKGNEAKNNITKRCGWGGNTLRKKQRASEQNNNAEDMVALVVSLDLDVPEVTMKL
jgi:hypothetical protein